MDIKNWVKNKFPMKKVVNILSNGESFGEQGILTD